MQLHQVKSSPGNFGLVGFHGYLAGKYRVTSFLIPENIWQNSFYAAYTHLGITNLTGSGAHNFFARFFEKHEMEAVRIAELLSMAK